MENPNTTQVSDAEESMENLTIEFGQTETVHQWCKLPECDEVVGSRFVFIHVSQVSQKQKNFLKFCENNKLSLIHI